MSTRRTSKKTSRPAAAKTARPAKVRAATGAAAPRPRQAPRSTPRVEPPPAPTHRFIVLTGLSGAGKSQAMRALEDLAYFCVDNLPITLLPTFAELTLRPDTEIEKAAVVIDVREGTLLEQFPRVFETLRAMPGLKPTLIFLEASEAALVRRYSETRRPHPLARHRSALEGVREERSRLAPIRRLADEIVDTSDDERARAARGLHGPLARDGADRGAGGDVPQLRLQVRAAARRRPRLRRALPAQPALRRATARADGARPAGRPVPRALRGHRACS